MGLSRQEEELEIAWLEDGRYKDGSGLAVSPEHLMQYLEDYTQLQGLELLSWMRNAEIDERFDADSLRQLLCEFADSTLYDSNIEPKIDYESLHTVLVSYSENREHKDEGRKLGFRLTNKTEFGEADADIFAWGYNLYFGILEDKKMLPRPTKFVWPRPTSPEYKDPENLTRLLSSIARDNLKFLADFSEALLDGLVKVHSDLGRIYDDDSEGRQFELERAREQRLEVMLAGLGWAYFTWQKSLEGASAKPFDGATDAPETWHRPEDRRQRIGLFIKQLRILSRKW